MATSATSSCQVFSINPYENHPSLSQVEAEVLWEYAKLNQHIKDLVIQTRSLSDTPDETMLTRLRILERKMGLVLTLFKASVWGVVNEQTISAHPQDGSYSDIH
ncbi:DASH complex subunit Dad3-domain-containing protein [Multifurca ochricompacta]|uniref:DASH complex subunit DAD3 n=1 Tax=Multifurca ochricompacta TaxID=376703 RepID=A0AAD4QQ94_9AGAM|nr:DASH complex subunit Dad3-domain-containing protein [Multifurca ochricompacta]